MSHKLAVKKVSIIILTSLLLIMAVNISSRYHTVYKNPYVAIYKHKYANMKLTLPEGWKYDYISGPGSHAYKEVDAKPVNVFGISFWPEEQPLMQIDLCYHVNFFGICGFGVTVSDVSFANGLTATKYTEIIDNISIFMIYNDVPGTYTVKLTVSTAMFDEYEATIMSILDTVEIGKDIMPKAEAVEIAKKECTVSYNIIHTRFEYTEGIWEVSFWKWRTNDAEQTIFVNPQGEIVDAINKN